MVVIQFSKSLSLPPKKCRFDKDETEKKEEKKEEEKKGKEEKELIVTEKSQHKLSVNMLKFLMGFWWDNRDPRSFALGANYKTVM